MLDNCEHLVDAVAVFVGAILRRCAGVKILATSRESLGLGGEVTMRVPSLTTPQQQPPEFEGIAQYESVSLFTERAASVVPGFTLTEENKRAVAHICHDLDGLPLPIELAAARLRGMSAEQIMNRLSDRYRLLTTGGRDVSESSTDAAIVDRLELRPLLANRTAVVGEVVGVLGWVRSRRR